MVDQTGEYVRRGDQPPEDPLLKDAENLELQRKAFETLREAFEDHTRIRELFDWDGDSISLPETPTPKWIIDGGRVVTHDHIEIHINVMLRNRGKDDPIGYGVRFRRPRPGYTGERGILSEYILFDRTGEPIPRQNTVKTGKEILRFARSLQGAK